MALQDDRQTAKRGPLTLTMGLAGLRIGITGSDGLLGWHLRAFLHGAGEIAGIRCAPRAAFGEPSALDTFAANLDVLVHMAGMNRGDDRELERTNLTLVDAVTAACDRTKTAPHVVFASSTHFELDTAYGRSKRECADRLRRWCGERDAPFTNMILPNVFGEFGRPFYNSVVSTFCHQLAHGETPTIDIDGRPELLHAQQVAEHVVRCVAGRLTGDVRIGGEPVQVSALLSRLRQLSEYQADHDLPALATPLDVQLFNTFRSYLFPHQGPTTLALRADHRGHLFEAVRTHRGGQAFLSWTHPGITRGNHYHRRKTERFLVLHGEACIRIRKLFTDEVHEYRVDSRTPRFLDMPTFHTHSITNTGGGELLTLFWSNEIFDPQDPDTYIEQVTPL